MAEQRNAAAPPAGAWPSKISAATVAQAGKRLEDVYTDNADPSGRPALYHLESRPSEKGRVALVYDGDGLSQSSLAVDVAPTLNVRSRVHEYGGGAAAVSAGTIVVSDFATNGVYAISRHGPFFSDPTLVVPDNSNHRYADFSFHPTHPHYVLAIREDHTRPAIKDVVNEVVLLDLQAKKVHVIVTGADFYAAGRWAAVDDWICWVAWEHPNMPWTCSELYVAQVDLESKNLLSSTLKKVAGHVEPKESISQPRWSNSGTALYFLSDRSDYYQLYSYDVTSPPTGNHTVLRSLTRKDMGSPDWVFGQASYVELTSGAVAVPTARGCLTLVEQANQDSPDTEKKWNYCLLRSLRPLGSDSIACIAESDSEPSVLTVLFTAGPEGQNRIIAKSADVSVDEKDVSIPKEIEYPTTGGKDWTAFGWYYPPTSSSYTLRDGTSPPLIVRCHGGPTSAAGPGFAWNILYWTSRGFAFVDLNYGGSTGHGRQFRERLDTNWGIVDVNDTVACVEYLGKAGMADPKKVAITGGSAGGYTVLASLCLKSAVFGAGASLYGVSDLKLLADDTHKFESQYLQGLLGGTPEEVPQVYRDRSPINHADQITSPLIVLQGADDKVVPPEQAERIVDAVKNNGGKVEYILFEGEGHGFRQAQNIERALDAQLLFFQDVFGLK